MNYNLKANSVMNAFERRGGKNYYHNCDIKTNIASLEGPYLPYLNWKKEVGFKIINKFVEVI